MFSSHYYLFQMAAKKLSDKSVVQLFETVLQHAKCIEIRVDYGRVSTSQKQKYVLTTALNKINSAINTICDLLPDSKSVLAVKEQLDQADMVWVMVLTEQLMRIKHDDMEEVVDLIDNYLINKYGQEEQVSVNGENPV